MITDVLASAISVLPNRLLHPALEAEAKAVDLAVTTIPGACHQGHGLRVSGIRLEGRVGHDPTSVASEPALGRR